MSFVQKAFEQITADRVHHVAFMKTSEDPEYIAAANKSEELYDQLADSLNDSQKALLSDLDDAWNYKNSFFIEYVYRQGLEDSPIITKELRKYGISITKEDGKRYYLAIVQSLDLNNSQSVIITAEKKNFYQVHNRVWDKVKCA
ncbi:hypothetical protein J9303_14935 [Bacillaceae bacterium Marseille-Q3522]|nr:hypothetical protein [Bacillaceae bacterium Marseille-Q3522]